jgi:hypothetical protein
MVAVARRMLPRAFFVARRSFCTIVRIADLLYCFQSALLLPRCVSRSVRRGLLTMHEKDLAAVEQLSPERGQSFDELGMEVILGLSQNRPKEETSQDSV